MDSAFDRFEAKWLARLRQDAGAAFYHGASAKEAATHAAIADAFIEPLGFKPIGYNWELLDAAAGADEPRSALGELTKAMASPIDSPGKTWLGEDVAHQCAADFLALFDPASRTIVSNRYDGLWNPIAGAPVEWGFVGFDQDHAALLLIAAQ